MTQSPSRQALLDAFVALTPALRAYARARLGDPSEVDDVVQEVASRILSSQLPEKIENKSAFLFSVTSNLLKDHYRRRSRRRHEQELSIYDIEIADDRASPEDVLEARARLARLAAGLAGLPADARAVFQLHRLDGLTLQETSERAGLSVARVRKLLERAIAQLARRVWSD